MSKELTEKQELFAIAYTLNGNNATKAYREFYSIGEDTLDSSVWVAAYKVKENAKVQQRIAELREQRFSKKILSIEERKILLSEQALEGDTKSIDLLNKMEGIYVEKKETKISGELEIKEGMQNIYKVLNEED